MRRYKTILILKENGYFTKRHNISQVVLIGITILSWILMSSVKVNVISHPQMLLVETILQFHLKQCTYLCLLINIFMGVQGCNITSKQHRYNLNVFFQN